MVHTKTQKTFKKQLQEQPDFTRKLQIFQVRFLFYAKYIALRDLITTNEQVLLNILKDRKRRVLLNKDVHINIMC